MKAFPEPPSESEAVKYEGQAGRGISMRRGWEKRSLSGSTNIMGSVWPQIAQGSGILMPQHTLLHTRMLPGPFAF